MALPTVSDRAVYIELPGQDGSAQTPSIIMDPICAICFEQVPKEEAIGHLAKSSSETAKPVFHGFHKPCIMPWQIANGTCPTCREELGQLEAMDGRVVRLSAPEKNRFNLRMVCSFVFFLFAFLLWYVGNRASTDANKENFHTAAAVVTGGGALMALYACVKCCCLCARRSEAQRPVEVE